MFALTCFIFNVILVIGTHADPNVTFAVVLFRHGDRTPVNPYPTDPWGKREYWPADFGQLTDKGKLQHFRLGKYFRSRYEHLLSETYEPKELYVQSTDFDRTIMSALANLAGLYPVKHGEEFVNSLFWKPIPVHSIPSELDNILGMQAPCPMYDLEMKRLLNSDTYKKLDELYAPVYEYLSNHTGKVVNSLQEVAYLYDTLSIETWYNFDLPLWTKEVFPDTMFPIALRSTRTETFTSKMQRLKSGPLVKRITTHLSEAAEKKQTHNLVMYSAHDTTLTNILNSLGMFQTQLPPYTAHLLIELLPGNEETDPFVRLTYQNNILDIPNCGTLCSLSRWKANYEWLMPVDYQLECTVRDPMDLKELSNGEPVDESKLKFIDT